MPWAVFLGVGGGRRQEPRSCRAGCAAILPLWAEGRAWHFSSAGQGWLCSEVKLWVSSAPKTTLSVLSLPMRAGLWQRFLVAMTAQRCCGGQPWHWHAMAWPGLWDSTAQAAGPEDRSWPGHSHALGLSAEREAAEGRGEAPSLRLPHSTACGLNR